MAELVTLIPWMLERLLNLEYVLETEHGIPQTMKLDPKCGISVEEMEKDLVDVLSPEHAYLLLALKEDHSEEDLTMALTEIFPGRGLQIAEVCTGKDWPQIVKCLYWELRRFADEIGEYRVRGREAIGGKDASKIDNILEESRPGRLAMDTAKKYARDLISLYPEIVNRAELLDILLTTKKAPENLSDYLREASGSYIYGHFLASLLLCRSAIETALENCLNARGFREDVEQITKDKLVNLLKLARRNDLIDRILFEQADDVRKLANNAVHNGQLQATDNAGMLST